MVFLSTKHEHGSVFCGESFLSRLGFGDVDASDFDQFRNILSISRQLERIADHATNIAEDVIYMAEGEIVRHGGDIFRQHSNKK